MPITPSEAKRIEQEYTSPPADLLTKIDAALSKGHRAFAVPSVIHSNYVEAVIAAYQYVGWKVTMTYDQRDGDYLKFSAPADDLPHGPQTYAP